MTTTYVTCPECGHVGRVLHELPMFACARCGLIQYTAGSATSCPTSRAIRAGGSSSS